MEGIVVTTHDTTANFLNDLLESLVGVDYPIVVWKNCKSSNGFELSGIHLGMKLFDEFLYLQDTVLIKDISIIYEIFSNKYKTISISLFPKWSSYLGKYQSSILRRINIPMARNKFEAVNYEHKFTQEYIKYCENYIVLFPEINAWKASKLFEFKHGRENCVYENEFIKKYKGTWSKEMIK